MRHNATENLQHNEIKPQHNRNAPKPPKDSWSTVTLAFLAIVL